MALVGMWQFARQLRPEQMGTQAQPSGRDQTYAWIRSRTGIRRPGGSAGPGEDTHQPGHDAGPGGSGPCGLAASGISS